MTQPTIYPGEGWRLLEPGEVPDRNRHECARSWNNPLQWQPVINLHGFPVDEDRLVSGYYVRERITPAASQWIPVSEKPLPLIGTGWVTYDNGNVRDCRQNGFQDITPVWRDRVIAWMPWELPAMPLPEPYVPPEPDLPRRCGTLPCGLKWVEKRDGDIDPDAANEARKFAEVHAEIHTDADYRAACRAILGILNGDEQ